MPGDFLVNSNRYSTRFRSGRTWAHTTRALPAYAAVSAAARAMKQAFAHCD